MPFRPTHLFYLSTLRCNERCSKCSHWKIEDHDDDLDPAAVVRAARSLQGLEELCITGGEPLLLGDRILAIAQGLDGSGIRTSIVTNGTLCGVEFLEALAPLNVHLVFSIDTIDPEFWRFVRGTDSFETVIENLMLARALLKPEKVSVQSVLARETQDHLLSVGAICEERGITQVVQEYLEEGFGGTWTPLRGLEETPVDDCRAAGRNLSIMPDGSVRTCFQQDLIPGCAEPLGSIPEQDITEIISSDYAAEVIERMRHCSLPCARLNCNRG